ncbi:IS5 family transposase IS4811 [Methylobacterium tardum]|nr:IS5 family transposase IS4811 [Methylobacterium tardum]
MIESPDYICDRPDMTDPLSQMVGLLRPEPDIAKRVVAGGTWRVTRADAGRPFYGAILEGRCRLDVAGCAPIVLEAGDFILVPAARAFAVSSLEPPPADAPTAHVETSPGLFQLGPEHAEPDIRMLVGHCAFASDAAGLLVSLLPHHVHVRGEPRLIALVELVNDETRSDRPGREAILGRLLEVLLIEALRSAAGPSASAGLLRGLHDDHLAAALRCIHDRPAQAWTVAALAREAALSRSAFFDRFQRAVGVAPMAYVTGWRMALAKAFLRREGITVAEAAGRVGYSSASTFSVAFTRHVGTPPALYARGA